jgi:phage recombination protein Bet
MSNIVEANNQIQSFGYNQDQVNLIKNTVAKGATNDELQMFMYLANQYNLDPFKREIWFVKYDKTANIMTSRDGYLKYAQMNEDFEGLISFVVKEGDVFEIDASEYKVNHKFGAKRGVILGAWARCDRKGKRPFIAYVEYNEYRKSTNIWNNYPSAMIQKVAEVFVLKRAFGINGLITREEIDAGETEVQITEEKPQTISKPQQKRMFAIAKENQELVRQAIQEKGFSGTSEVTKDVYEEICTRIEKLAIEFEVVDKIETEFIEGEYSDEEEEEVIYPWDDEESEDDEDIPY